jgi:hypothetical protein
MSGQSLFSTWEMDAQLHSEIVGSSGEKPTVNEAARGFSVFLASRISHSIWASPVEATVATKKFWSSMSFKNLVRLSQIKKNPCLIMPTSTKCQKKREKK